MHNLTKEDITAKLKNYFETEDDVLMAFLFGSYAKGRTWKHSDIDIAIWLKNEFSIKKMDRIWFEIEDVLKKEVDLISLNRASPTVAWSALRGIPIVIKDYRFYLEYMLRITREGEDFRKFIMDVWRINQGIRNPRNSPLNEEQKESIEKRVLFIKAQLQDLGKYKNINFNAYKNDRNIQKIVERTIENIANASIDIAKILIASETLEIPETYKEAFLKLSEIKFLDVELARRLGELAKLRNIIAHEYLDIRWDRVKSGIDMIEDIKEFLEIVAKKLNES